MTFTVEYIPKGSFARLYLSKPTHTQGASLSHGMCDLYTDVVWILPVDWLNILS